MWEGLYAFIPTALGEGHAGLAGGLMLGQIHSSGATELDVIMQHPKCRVAVPT